MIYRFRLLLICLTLIAGSLSLAADPLADVRDWPGNGLPVAAEWAMGHNSKWSVSMIRDGKHRLLPHVILPVSDLINIPKQATNLDAYASELKYISDNGLPLVLRHQSQLAQDMTGEPRGTYPGNTAVEWRKHPDTGVNDSRPVCDMLAASSFWDVKGKLYGNSTWAVKLQTLCPSPAWVGIWDNNESGTVTPKAYVNIAPGAVTWKSRPELEAISYSMRDHVATASADPFDFWPHFYQQRSKHFRTLYSGFKGTWTAWKGKPLITVAYSAGSAGGIDFPAKVTDAIGFTHEALCFDGVGPSCYPGQPVETSNLLNPMLPDRVLAAHPGWEWSRKNDPAAFPVVFVSLQPKAALAAAILGTHEPISPDLFRAYCEYMAWLARPKTGGTVLLQHWIGFATLPATPFFDAAQQAQFPALAGVTHGDYSIAPAFACDSICHPLNREFWRQGVSVPVTCSNENVRAVAVKYGAEYLVYTWSPCKLTGEMTLDIDGGKEIVEVIVPSAGSRYVTVGTDDQPDDPPVDPPVPGDTVQVKRADLQALRDAIDKLLGGVQPIPPKPVDPVKPPKPVDPDKPVKPDDPVKPPKPPHDPVNPKPPKPPKPVDPKPKPPRPVDPDKPVKTGRS